MTTAACGAGLPSFQLFPLTLSLMIDAHSYVPQVYTKYLVSHGTVGASMIIFYFGTQCVKKGASGSVDQSSTRCCRSVNSSFLACLLRPLASMSSIMQRLVHVEDDHGRRDSDEVSGMPLGSPFVRGWCRWRCIRKLSSAVPH